MNLSVDLYQKRIITPIWSSSITTNTTILPNVFPIRQQNHSRRFYGKPNLRKPNNNAEFFLSSGDTSERDFSSNESQMSKYNNDYSKNRAHTTMAFCSTSKVKHMPLPGFANDPFAGLRLGTNHPTIYSNTFRPVSRPVVLHGKRFTLVPSEGNRSNTGFSQFYQSEENGEDEKKFVCDISLQRRRFYEAEKNKTNFRIQRKIPESQEGYLPRNYFVSGRKLNLFGIKDGSDDSSKRLQPSLKIDKGYDVVNGVNHDENNLKIISHSKNLSKDEEVVHSSNSTLVIDINDAADIDKDDSTNKNQEITNSINKYLQYYDDIDSELVESSREWLIDFLLLFLNEIKDLEIIKTENPNEAWSILSPKQMLDDNDFETPKSKYYELFDTGDEPMNVEHVLQMILEKYEDKLEQDIFNKIFAVLDKTIVTKKEFEDIVQFSQIFENSDITVNPISHQSLLCVLFWLQLHQHIIGCPITEKHFLDIFVPFLIGRRPPIDQKLTDKISQSAQHYNLAFSNLNDPNLVLLSSWIHIATRSIHINNYSIDDICYVRSLFLLTNQ